MRFPLALTTKIAAYIVGQKIRGTKKFATVLQLEPLHTCNLTCTGCGRIREYSTSLKDMMPLEDCLAARGRMRRADGFDLRRRTADLSANRRAGRRSARAGPHRLHLHERHVHAQKNARMMAQRVTRNGRRSSTKRSRLCWQQKLITEKDAAAIRKGRRTPAKPIDRPEQMDVLERPPRRSGMHARSDRRARRRFQGMRRGDQDGEDPRLPGRDQHDGLQGDRHGGDRADVRLS